MTIDDRCKLMEVPTDKRPGWDYYWDYDKHKWVQVKDDDDMTWWMDRIVENGSRLLSGKFSGKEWKDMFRNEGKVFDYFI